jgi:signal transduction histidine kinase
MRALCHDLIQPLTAIRVLADPRIGHDDSRLAAIRHEVAWLTDLVESVLDGAAEDRYESLDLKDVAAYAVSCGAPSAAVTLEGSSDVRVAAPRVALVRALRCLLDNAARAAGKDGRVTVCVRAVESRAVVTVADDGPGLGHLAPQHSIGLVTVVRVLRDCGGRLELEDGPLGGAVATVELPLLAHVHGR